MTLSQWSAVHTVMAWLWPQHKAPEVDVLKAQLSALPPWLTVEQATGAARQIWLTGEKWPPSGGEIAALAMKNARPPAPAPGTILALLTEAAGTFGARRELDAIRWLAERSPHAARFAVEHGWTQFCREGLFDPEYGGAVRQRLERSAQSCAAGVEREHREGRVLPLVQEHVARLAAGQPHPAGLRLLGLADALPAPPAALPATTDRRAA